MVFCQQFASFRLRVSNFIIQSRCFLGCEHTGIDLHFVHCAVEQTIGGIAALIGVLAADGEGIDSHLAHKAVCPFAALFNFHSNAIYIGCDLTLATSAIYSEYQMGPHLLPIATGDIGITISGIPFHGKGIGISVKLTAIEQEFFLCAVVQRKQLAVFSGSIMTGGFIPHRNGKGILTAAKYAVRHTQPIFFTGTLGGKLQCFSGNTFCESGCRYRSIVIKHSIAPANGIVGGLVIKIIFRDQPG